MALSTWPAPQTNVADDRVWGPSQKVAGNHSRFHISRAVHQIWAITITPLFPGWGVPSSERSGQKWEASATLALAEENLKLKDIIGAPCTGRQGLGMTHFQEWGKANPVERRAMVRGEVRGLEEERRKANVVGLGSQGSWTRWDLPKRKMTWADLWRLEPFRLSFLLRAVYDTLPTPVNLKRWGMRDDPTCKLCGQKWMMAHILSGCKTALAQGRYRWRHDKVLTMLADILEQERTRKRQRKSKPLPGITFLKEGTKPSGPNKSRVSLLQSAQAWELRVDLKRRLQFPDVVHTSWRPDAVLFYTEGKKIILVELTVPWEEGWEEAFERKSERYKGLVQDCRDKGWQTWLYPVEERCRGFPAQSAWKLMTEVGLRGTERKNAVRRLGETAERASCWIWSRREELSWQPGGSE